MVFETLRSLLHLPVGWDEEPDIGSEIYKERRRDVE